MYEGATPAAARTAAKEAAAAARRVVIGGGGECISTPRACDAAEEDEDGDGTPAARSLDSIKRATRTQAAQAHGAGALLSVDSTFATPVVQRPLEHGVDLVVHSATKALAGHSDVTAGVVLGDAARMEAVAGYRKVTGAILDPAAAWLLRRSLAPLGLRVEAQCRSAQALAEALSARPEVSRVHYPGLPADPGHGLARRMLAPGQLPRPLCYIPALKIHLQRVSTNLELANPQHHPRACWRRQQRCRHQGTRPVALVRLDAPAQRWVPLWVRGTAKLMAVTQRCGVGDRHEKGLRDVRCSGVVKGDRHLDDVPRSSVVYGRGARRCLKNSKTKEEVLPMPHR